MTSVHYITAESRSQVFNVPNIVSTVEACIIATLAAVEICIYNVNKLHQVGKIMNTYVPGNSILSGIFSVKSKIRYSWVDQLRGLLRMRLYATLCDSMRLYATVCDSRD